MPSWWPQPAVTPPLPDYDESARHARAITLALAECDGVPQPAIGRLVSRLRQGARPRTLGEALVYAELAREGLVPDAKV